MKKTILYLLLFCCAITSFAQQPVTIQLTEKDGLPDIEFYNIIEDSNGFIWLAADKGFYCYDGKEYENYTNSEKRGLSVFEPVEDKKGRVWCVNISGQLFYTENGKLITFADLGEILKGELINFIVRDNDILVFSINNVYSINLKSKLVSTIFATKSLIGVPFFYNNELLLNIENKIYAIIGNKLVSRNILITSYDFSLLSKTSFFQYDKDLYFLQPTNKYIFKVGLSKSSQSILLPSDLQNKQINYIFVKDNILWVCTSAGVYVYSIKNNQFILKAKYLENIFVTKMIFDHNENYWFGTLKDGIFVIPNIHINKYAFRLKLGSISCLTKVNEEILFYGTTNGEAGLYNIKTNTVKSIPLLSKRNITSALYNPLLNEIYISQEDKSYYYNVKKHSIENQNTFLNAKRLTLINENTFLSTSFNGAEIIKNRKDMPISKRDDLIFKRTYTSHFSSHSGKIYVAYVDNLVVFDKNLNESIIRNNGKPIFAIDIVETADGTVWVSTFKDGVFGIKDGEIIVNYTEANGLVSNQTSKIKNQNNNLWIVTDKGIQLLNTAKSSFQTLTKTDGIDSYTISGLEIFDKQLVFSSNKNLFSLDTKNVFKKTNNTNIYFTSVAIDETEVKLGRKYVLEHQNNSIKISFNSNGFLSSNKYTYKYRLLGLNKKWVNLESGINFVKYNSLPAGDYVFQVAYQNGSLFENSIKEIAIEVQSPFWEKWWFYSIIGVCLLAFFWGYFSWRINRLKQRQKEILDKELINKKLVFSQLEALRSQMNPHFIFNALNSIQEYIVLNDGKLARMYLVKFSKLIRIYLEHSQQNEIVLKEEIKALELYLELEKLRFEDVLQYDLTIAANLSQEKTKIPSLFIQPYVENAIKHGLLHKKGERKLLVSFRLNLEETHLICCVEDNGIGRNASFILNQNKVKYHTSFATSANEKRLNLINIDRLQKISIETIDLSKENNECAGTRIIITIPLNN
ncbi:sensor histidine kinase [Flavobacterium sp. LMO9]|uniref:sensor histidine kinase n=1 Tax=Flavobacterium sp. LMO9 TaxID=2654245 RepID=UPI0012917D0B|nr:sensor histidine kinase [Flavobacterium sp. LMO9]MQP53251.1 hypothetical protein [Flavobacterium sp. LMO9]